MDFLPPNIEAYAEEHSEKEPELLAKLNRETHLKIMQPRMLSGHYQGRVLSMLSKLIRPKTILEIGTYTGYSALCLMEGVQKNGTLHTIDKNEELHDFQRKYFDASAWGNQIKQHTGDATKVIKNLEENFDLVFIDADKANYVNYFELVVSKMNQGGVILSDNVLWSGKVTEKPTPNDIDTQALLAYNKLLATDKRVETVLLPIRDGLSITRVV
ncbi:O-methyltransferase [Haloflavibacter putidus]|uniref:O-methyltransferase n=1 Tax=Haloflavibacter putidus TaxID=2576776 RepID=A0A507ZL64_9FLAO|nr:O-methyltransferase [Haloflavibacter putidus]TQD37737.1 O-methyltransferase [Haloflavibacter putidus]